MTFKRITFDPKRMNGQPCVRQLRLTVRRVVEAVATYPDRRDLKREFPELEPEDIREALAYAAAKRDKLPIGTGVTEAAAKTLVSVRMKRSGARYSDHGGHTIITLRAALLSGRFEAFSAELEASYAAVAA